MLRVLLVSNLLASIQPTDAVRYARLVRAVRGVTPGMFDPETRQFYAMTWEAKNIGCPDCWAGVSHSVAAWDRFHGAGAVEVS